MNQLDDRLRRLLDQRLIALWVAELFEEQTLRAAFSLPWQVVWSEVDPTDLTPLLTDASNRPYCIVENKNDIPPSGTSSNIGFIYNLFVPEDAPSSDTIRKRRRATELENTVEEWTGLLVYAGSEEQFPEWLTLIGALAPSATVLVDFGTDAHSSAETQTLEVISWHDTLSDFFLQVCEYYTNLTSLNVLDLKGAPGVTYDPDEFDALGGGWHMLTRKYISKPATVTQDDFDGFLSGDAAWTALSAGAAHSRGPICRFRSAEDKKAVSSYDPVEFVLRKIDIHHRSSADPLDAVEQILIFAEPGSGCSTILRQIALAVARQGYPTLITTPHPRRLGLESLVHFVVHLQDAWTRERRNKGTMSGTLPVCLVLDVDAELPAHFGKLARGLLGDLHRKIVLVRALQRSDVEIRNAKGVLRLEARTTEAEILSLGSHLRSFCKTFALQPIPGESEWKAFYNSFGRLAVGIDHSTRDRPSIPPLFLIGLYPFVKERVRDERSLEQYLYRRWEQIKNPSGRELIQILATAGAHGIAVPFEPLLREPNLTDALFNKLDKDDQRLVDFFCRWQQFGWERRNWALYIRHAALGMLLTRMLNPSESDMPFTPLLSILTRLAGTEADRWFVEQLVYRLGRKFGSQAPAFSLEIDTAAQRASRAVFKAIPEGLYNTSRTVCHHHARFHIHLLHACLKAIQNPDSTNLPQHVVRPLAQGALEEATLLLERARNVPDDQEKMGNVLNSLAAGISQLARVYAKQGEPETSIQHYREAIDRANEAISHDAANGHALYNLLNTILHKFEDDLVADPREAEELYEICEERLETLFQLHDNRQWRNANEDDAEFAVASIVRRHLDIAKKLQSNSRANSFRVTSKVAEVLLEVRAISGSESLRTVFLDPGRASRLRELRSRFTEIPNISSRALLILYKLYLNDPTGRLCFAERLGILGRVERLSPDDYDPYRHDRAALFCLTGSFEAGTTLFEQIYINRESDPERWFWVNERLLLEVEDGRPIPKQHVVRVTDHRLGWARLENTRIRVKIQPRQFGELKTGQYVKVFIRFRLTGLQAVTDRMASFDLAAMGYEQSVLGS